MKARPSITRFYLLIFWIIFSIYTTGTLCKMEFYKKYFFIKIKN